jgi:RNA polymerase sigma factor (sigma-70 family)
MNKLQRLGELFTRHRPELLRLLKVKFKKHSDDAEDIVQDVFQNVLKIENLESIENPRAYLFQAAQNLALNRIRSHNTRQQYIDEQDAEDSNELSPERIVFAAREMSQVSRALNTLPEKYRRTFLMSRMENKTYKEISLDLGIAESTVEKHIIKVLGFLRQHAGKE